MKIEVLADADAVAHKAAEIIALEARGAVAERDRFILAVSGGHTPWLMLRALAGLEVPWEKLHLVQVDERVAPRDIPIATSLTCAKACSNGFLCAPIKSHTMPVESPDLEAGAQTYCRTLAEIAGFPPILDLVHLGLGPDGHTASLVPGDAVLNVTDAEVALTGVYQGRRRMTLTYPVINRSRRILWLVTGNDKAGPLVRLCDADPSIPAGRIRQDQSLLLADRAAATELGTN